MSLVVWHFGYRLTKKFINDIFDNISLIAGDKEKIDKQFANRHSLAICIFAEAQEGFYLGLDDPEDGNDGIHNGFLHSSSGRACGGTKEIVQFCREFISVLSASLICCFDGDWKSVDKSMSFHIR